MKRLKLIKKIFSYIKEFGIFFSLVYFWRVLNKDYIKRQKMISNYLDRVYSIKMEVDLDGKNISNKIFPIWVLWWQGRDRMPPTVNKCYLQLENMAEGCDLTLITAENFKDYVDIPQYVLDKFYAKKFSITHLSDILRFALLDKYGGMWIDATVFVTEPIVLHQEIINAEFFTIKQGDYIESFNIAHGRWTGFLMATAYKGHPFFKAGLKCFYKYWEEHDILIDYFLIDYIICYLQKKYDKFNFLLQEVPINNINVFKNDCILQHSDKQNTMFFKLSWKNN